MSAGTLDAPRSLASIDKIEGKIDKQTAGAVSVNPKAGLVVESLGQAMELAKLMSISNTAVPKHLRGDPGACLAIAIQGYEWSINPFALANKSYVVNDRLAYESALYHAVVQRRAPIKGRIKHAYEGDGNGRRCRVWAVIDDGSSDEVEYLSPTFGNINPKNSPLWKNDPDQQLFYFSIRAFARRHFPDVMMGIYTVDEVLDDAKHEFDQTTDRGAADLTRRLTQRPVSEGQTFEPAEEAIAAQQGSDSQEKDVAGADAEPAQREPVKTWAEFLSAAESYASSNGIPPAALMAGVNAYILATGKKGKESKIDPDLLNMWLVDLEHGTGNFER